MNQDAMEELKEESTGRYDEILFSPSRKELPVDFQLREVGAELRFRSRAGALSSLVGWLPQAGTRLRLVRIALVCLNPALDAPLSFLSVSESLKGSDLVGAAV